MKQIIVLSNERWSQTPARTQHLISRIKDARILYFCPAQSPIDQSFRKKGKHVKPNVTAYTLPPMLLPVTQAHPGLFQLFHRRMARFITKTAAENRFHQSLLWVTNPAHIHLLDHLDYGSLVFDCATEYDDLPPDWEGSLAHAADLVFAASRSLCDRLSPCSENVALLENGVNYPLFSSIAKDKPQGRPTLGWAGTIYTDTDLSPLLYAAQRQSGWSFRITGQCSAENPYIQKLKRLPHVKFQGKCPLLEVPEQLSRCDVLMDFQRLHLLDTDIVPTRLYEYLATGKPIVSMHLPDQVELFPDVVYAAHSPAEFLSMCHHALSESPGWVTGRRQQYSQEASWANRADEVSRILKTGGLFL